MKVPHWTSGRWEQRKRREKKKEKLGRPSPSFCLCCSAGTRADPRGRGRTRTRCPVALAPFLKNLHILVLKLAGAGAAAADDEAPRTPPAFSFPSSSFLLLVAVLDKLPQPAATPEGRDHEPRALGGNGMETTCWLKRGKKREKEEV